MATIVQIADFVDEINLPTGSDPINAQVQRYIDKYEREILVKCLGETLYAQLMAGLNVTVPDEPEEKWASLASFVKPISAYYVYCNYMKKEATSTQRVGEVKSKTQNSTIVNANYKIVNAWNELDNIIYSLDGFLDDNYSTYDSWQGYVPYLGLLNTFGL